MPDKQQRRARPAANDADALREGEHPLQLRQIQRVDLAGAEGERDEQQQRLPATSCIPCCHGGSSGFGRVMCCWLSHTAAAACHPPYYSIVWFTSCFPISVSMEPVISCDLGHAFVRMAAPLLIRLSPRAPPGVTLGQSLSALVAIRRLSLPSSIHQ